MTDEQLLEQILAFWARKQKPKRKPKARPRPKQPK
jgi:hypothetical protein